MQNRESTPRTSTGRFEKGSSGNPAGRPPRGQTFAESLRDQLERVKNGVSTRDALAAVVVALALKGDLDAIKWIVDRVDGKVADRLVTSTADHAPDDATLDAVADRWTRLRSLRGGAA